MAHVDEKMGALSTNAGVFRFDQKQVLTIPLPLTSVIQKGTSPEQIKSVLETLPVVSYLAYQNMVTHTSLCTNGRSLVQTLLNVYEKTNRSSRA